jgi:vacuolar-type H+-ATPase subunit I/STV1
MASASSTIVEEIEALRKSGLASLAMFYCDFREDQKKDLRGLLSSAIFQLCDQSDSYHEILSKFYSTHRDGEQSPSDDELAQCLKDVLGLPKQAPVYLIIDALDECSNTSSMPSPREKILKLLIQLIESRLPNLRICVTSRPEIDIKVVLEPLAFRSISIHDERGQLEDIENYIRSVINTDPKNQRWKQEDRQRVIDVLKERADGM